MDPKSSKLQHREQQEAAVTSHSAQTQSGQTFGSVEDLLRYDAAQTPPPLAVAERLAQSIAREPPRFRSWWERLFRRPSSSP
jgi:hypothetical protein